MLDINNAEKQFKEYLKNFDTENEKNKKWKILDNML